MKHWLLLALLALAGCSLEPVYDRPPPPVPPSWPAGDAYLRQSEQALPAVSYRDIFQDPRLQAVIAQALANNRDLRIAAANIAAARAQYRIARSDLVPTVDGGAGISFSDSGNSSSGNNNVSSGGVRESYSVDIGLSAFEIDLFGRVRSLSNAALQSYFAQESAARATRLSLVGEVASAYLTYAADRTLLANAEATAANAARSVEITGARYRGGIAPRLDLRQAETVLEQARSDVAEQQTAVAQDINALQLLVGGPVDAAVLPTGLEQVDGLLRELPAGLSSEILLRRPDVVQAEYDLRAANAQIGAARAALFPRISLTAVAGLASSALGGLFSGNAFSWTVAPNLSVPIFDGGASRGNLAAARAQQQLTLARYEQAIQTAFREVSDALVRRGTIDRQLAAQQRLVAAARDTFQLTDARYRGGIDNFLASLDAQRTLYSAEQSLARTRLVRALNLVDLYRTLGGDSLADLSPYPGRLERRP